MQADAGPGELLDRRDGWIAILWFALYMAWLFRTLEGEWGHWLTMVLVPLAIALVSLPSGRRSLKNALVTVGLRRHNLTRGIGWAILAGAAITVFQILFGGHSAAIQALIRNGTALWLFPISLIVMMLLAGFTEEMLFRGFIQTRLQVLFRSRWIAVLVTSLLFGLYHLPYAYLNPNWPSAGDWGAAWGAALGNGVPGGLVLGGLYVLSRGNLVACVLLHSLINAAPAMTIIRIGGG